MKVLILVENLEINRTSSGLRSHKHIILYQKYFKNIDVVTATPSHLMQKLNAVNYHHINTNKKIKNKWINKIPKFFALQNFLFGIDIVSHQIAITWILKAEYLIRKNKYDFVVSLGTGASFTTAYALYKLRKKIDFFHLMFIHDPYPLNQYPQPMKKRNSLPYQSVGKLFGKIIKSANFVSFPSLKLMVWMNEFYPFIESKHIIQPHIGMDLINLKKYINDNDCNNIPRFKEGLNIVHTGSLLHFRNPLFLIKAIQKLLLEFPESQKIIHLHIIGKINKVWNNIDLKSDNFTIYPNRFSYIQSLEIQQKADVLILLEPVAKISPIMLGKLADYLISKKPILALTPKISETRRILGSNYPLMAENGELDDIYSKLKMIYKAYLNNSLDNYLPPQEAIEHVSSKKWISGLEEIKNKVINSTDK